MSKIPQTPVDAFSSLLSEYDSNPYSLSKGIKLSYSAVRQIVIGKTKITVPTAFRLAKFFGQDPEYWLNLQRNADIEEAAKDKKLQVILKSITKVKKPAPGAGKKAKPAVKTAAAGKSKKPAKAPAAKPAAKGRKVK